MNTDEATVSLGKRASARVVDSLIVVPIVVIAQVIGLVSDNVGVTILSLVLLLAALGLSVYNQIVRVGLRGQSFGKQLLGIRVIDQGAGEPIGVGRALGRDFVFGLLFAACWIPGIVNIFVTAKDPRRQGWHDKVAGSVAVSAVGQGSGGAQEQPLPEATPSTPSLATGTLAPPPYSPSAPPMAPVAPSAAGEPPPSADTVVAPQSPASGPAATTPPAMVGPPPGVTPPPPSPEPDEPAPAEDSGVGVETDDADGSTGWTLTTSDGDQLVVEGLVLVGRDPDPELVAGAEPWAIDDPQLTMSKTHALLGLEDGTAWVEDWHSTNGVALHRGEAALVIEPHARTPLRDGDVIEFGAYKVTVERRS